MVARQTTDARESSHLVASVLGIAATAVALGGVGYWLQSASVPAPATVGMLAILAPLLGAAAVPAVSLGGDRLRNAFAVSVGVATAALTLRLVPYALAGDPSLVHYEFAWAPVVDVAFGLYVDALGVALASVAGVVGALVLVVSTRFMERESGLARYYALTLLFVGAMVGFALTDSLVALYVFWEVLGLCSFGLIAFWLRDPASTRAGMKAFVTTRFGDVGLLAGVAILYVAGGTFSIQELLAGAGALPGWALAWTGGLFILAAVGKSAQFPLHVWLPDAMEAPTTITALIHAACMVNAGIYLLARTLPLFDGLGWWLATVMVVGAASAFLAALLATVETDFKRAIAYCTISQLGYMMAALGLSGGLLAASFHLVSHSIFKALLFLAAGSVIYALGGSVHKHVDMVEAAGVGNLRRMPVTNVAFLVGLLGLTGVPGFNGFWSKELVLHAGLDGGPLETATAAVLAVTAVLTVVYSLRIYSFVFTGEASADTSESPPAITAPLVVLAALTATSWLAIGPFSSALAAYVPSVHAMTLAGLFEHVLTASTLALTAGIFGLGYLGFRYRRAINAATPDAVLVALERGYGFDEAYLALVGGYAAGADRVRRLQTGDLNYNLVGVVLALALGVGVVLV